MKNKNYAFIPARKGSKGFKDKNLIFFKNTAKFLKKINLFDDVYVSSNDERMRKLTYSYNFKFHKRSATFSGNKISIKQTLKNFVHEKKISKNSTIWLFYIPILYKNFFDFKKAKKISERKSFKSLCSFINVDHSPYSCWYKKGSKMFQFIKNDYYRRQDLPRTYSHHHYLCAFKTKYLNLLNSELIYKNTIPIILSKVTSSKLIEIDTKKDFKKLNYKDKKKYIHN